MIESPIVRTWCYDQSRANVFARSVPCVLCRGRNTERVFYSHRTLFDTEHRPKARVFTKTLLKRLRQVPMGEDRLKLRPRVALSISQSMGERGGLALIRVLSFLLLVFCNCSYDRH